MNEAQRQFVMGVAGVRLWYARASLPGAAPSPDFDFAEAEEPETITQSSAVPVPAVRERRPASDISRKGLARLQGLLADTVADPAPKSPQEGIPSGPLGGVETGPVIRESFQPIPPGKDAPEPEQALVAQISDALSGKVISFHWRFWIGERWMLVSSCPDAASRGLEDRLAANIMHALGDGIASTEALNWPVFSNPAVPGNDASGAVELISAMGEAITRPRQLWLGLEPDESDHEASALWRSVSAPLGEATVSFPLSLVALSSDPRAKAALWQALQQTGQP